MADSVVIVGGGQAAVQLCIALRKEKFDGDLVVFSEEGELPYHRPPLSKAFIAGKTDEIKLAMRPASFYESRNIELRLNDQVNSIDLNEKMVSTSAGSRHYDQLVLATGAVARSLSLEGLSATGVFELRNLRDARAIKQYVEIKPDVVIVGAGFIGLEAASALSRMGLKVTVFDTADRVMGRAVSPEVSDWFTKRHTEAGIDIYLNEAVAKIITDQQHRVIGVERANGEVIQASMVLIGIGVIPNSALAEEAGIQCKNGVLVDKFCRSSDAAVFAAGDCANHPNPFASGRQIRLESVQNATDQARTIASVITASKSQGSEPQPYTSVPWFWSDQGEHNLQMAGLGFDVGCRIVRGDPDAGGFSVFQYAGSKLVAVDSVNVPRDHMLARKMLGAGISPTVEQAADLDFDLKSLL